MDDSGYFTIRIPKPTRRWLQFSLATFLIVSLLAGVIFGVLGRRATQTATSNIYTKVYNVADVLFDGRTGPIESSDKVVADFDGLVARITRNVAPQSWAVAGGPGAIEPFRTNLSLVVSQSEDIHEQLADFLDAERQAPNALSANR